MTKSDPTPPNVPGLVGFFADVHDRHGRFAGWQPIAWGLRPWAGPEVVTIAAYGPPQVTWWRSLDAAEDDLSAVVGVVRDGTVRVTAARLLGLDVTGSADGPLLPPGMRELKQDVQGPPASQGNDIAVTSVAVEVDQTKGGVR